MDSEALEATETRAVPSLAWRVYWPLLAGCLTVLAVVVAAPWAAHHESPLAGWLYLPFMTICHQIGERSFHLMGHALAVCHRCTGLYVGFTVGLMVLPFLGSVRRFLFSHPRILLVLAVPMALDVFLWQNTWWSRFSSGLVAAFPVGLFVWAAFSQLARRSPVSHSPNLHSSNLHSPNSHSPIAEDLP